LKIKELQQNISLRLSSFLFEGEVRAVVNLVMEHFTGCNSLFINLNPQTEVDVFTVNRINEAVNHLLKNEPVQYALGETVFCKLPFMVSDSVLIPRPETEELVFWVIKENQKALKVLDICTGSGCIAVSLAKNIKNSSVYAVEISKEALNMAQKNAELNDVEVNFMQYDIFSSDFLYSMDMKFDVIVSNPPYVRDMEKSCMHSRVLDYEPHIALFVDDEHPLLFYHKILQFGKTHLSSGGKLYFEINENYGNEMIDLYENYGYTNVRLKQDIHGKDRMICGDWKIVQ
jgi:release factor glutamine methyltransferase